MKEPKDFYVGDRAERGVVRFPIHVLLDMKEREKLAALSHKWKKSAAQVVRDLLAKARA